MIRLELVGYLNIAQREVVDQSAVCEVEAIFFRLVVCLGLAFDFSLCYVGRC